MYTDGGLNEGKYEQHVTTFPNKQESLLKLKVPHCCPQPSGSFSPYWEEKGVFQSYISYIFLGFIGLERLDNLPMMQTDIQTHYFGQNVQFSVQWVEGRSGNSTPPFALFMWKHNHI